MSLFVASLAFRDPHHIAQAKMGILAGSLISGVVGYQFLAGIERIRRASMMPQPGADYSPGASDPKVPKDQDAPPPQI
jgi:NhaA family Na+:H+ antiporter